MPLTNVTATLTLIPSFGACTRSWLVTSYRSVGIPDQARGADPPPERVLGLCAVSGFQSQDGQSRKIGQAEK